MEEIFSSASRMISTAFRFMTQKILGCEIKLLQDFFVVVFFHRVAGWLMNGGNLLQRLSHDFNGFPVHDAEDTGLRNQASPGLLRGRIFPPGRWLADEWRKSS